MRYRKNLLIIFLLILIMLFSVSCKPNIFSNDTTKGTTEKSRDIEEKIKAKSKKGKNKKKDGKKDTKETKRLNEDDDKKVKKSSGVPHILLKEVREMCNYDDIEYGGALYTIGYQYLQLRDDEKEFGPLTKAIEEYNEGVNLRIEDTREAAKNMAEAEKKNRAAGLDSFMIQDTTTTYIIRADRSIVSLLNYKETAYTKGAPNYLRLSYNFDTQTGKRLKFTDVVKDDEAFFELVDAAKARDYNGLDITEPSEYAKSLKESDYEDLVWTVNPEGVTVYFDTYMLGTYTDGPQIITIYFADNQDIFEPDYVCKDEEYVFPIMTDNMKIYLDVDGDGEREPIYVNNLYDQNEDSLNTYETGMEVFVGEGKSKQVVDGYDGQAYIVRKSGKYYMYLFINDDTSFFYRLDLADADHEDRNYSLFDLSRRDNKWDQEADLEKYELVLETLTDTKSFVGMSMSDLLSTMESEKKWFVGDDGYPQTNEERGRIQTGIVLRTLKDFNCSEVDEKGKVKKGTKTIPSGSYLLPIYSDDEKYVDVRIIEEKDVDVWEGEYETYFSVKDDALQRDYDGPCYRITVEEDEESGNREFDGTNINDLFEGMLFAG